jgi:hypothetical protein
MLKRISILLVLGAVLFSCTMPTGNPGENSSTVKKNLVLQINSIISELSRAIIVKQYTVTSLDISVTCVPTNKVVYNATWLPSDGAKKFNVETDAEGAYAIKVVHHGVDTTNNTIAVDENATVLIQSMIISTVTIIPGYIGVININYGGSSVTYVKVLQNGSIIENNGTFNFDAVPAASRTTPVTFTILNAGASNLQLTSAPMISIGSSPDFTVDQTSLLTTIAPNQSSTFTIQYKGTSTDNTIKNATIRIPNNFGVEYVFTIGCTARASGTENITSTCSWKCPVVCGNILVSLAGGGGGGSSTNGGGGGGSGWLVSQEFNLSNAVINYTVIIGSGGAGASGYGNGGQGGVSQFSFNSSVLLSASGGNGGGGAGNTPGAGGALNGGNGGGRNGGNGGAIIFRGNNMGYGPCGTDNDEPGKSAPTGSGGGGGGGGDSDDSGSIGGNGGSGFAILEWVGFIIP